MTDTPTRFAVVRGRRCSQDTIDRYMPSGYTCVAEGTDAQGEWALICGIDIAGWTLHDYVRPRLASGLYSCSELIPQVPNADATLDAIAQLMNRTEWDSDTAPHVAALVRATGRYIGDPNE